MAHMMLFFELMRVKREYNAETRNQLSIKQKMDRMQKQIDRTTKYYTSLFTQLDNQAKSMQNTANMYFQSMTGGNDFSGINSMYGVLPRFISQIFTKDSDGNMSYQYVSGQDKDGKATYKNLTDAQYKELDSIYKAHNGTFCTTKDGKTTYYGIATEELASAYQQAQNAAQTIQQNVKYAVSQMSNMFQNNVSSWLECQKANLEAEQDAALDALNYEETMLECDQTSSKVRMEELKAEKESLQEELKERVQEDAPGFGL